MVPTACIIIREGMPVLGNKLHDIYILRYTQLQRVKSYLIILEELQA